MPSSPAPGSLDPSVQALVTQAIGDLSQRTGIAAAQIVLLDAQPVTWPDRSLGCPQPGMVYPQVQVDGLRIRLRAGGQVYEYHSGGERGPFLCP